MQVMFDRARFVCCGSGPIGRTHRTETQKTSYFLRSVEVRVGFQNVVTGHGHLEVRVGFQNVVTGHGHLISYVVFRCLQSIDVVFSQTIGIQIWLWDLTAEEVPYQYE